MNQAWFYLPDLDADAGTMVLDEKESRHALRARRLQVGDQIVVFNGRGDLADATLMDKGGTVELSDLRHAPAPQPVIDLAAALPKGERLAVLLSMTAQLGIRSFTPLICEHGVVRPGKRHGERGTRIFIEACKQSRNPWLAEWRAASTPAQVESGGELLFAHPGGAPLAGLALRQAGEYTVLVGPEAGFSDSEVSLLESRGARAVSLGELILRTETAAVALVAGLRQATVL